MPQPHNSRTCPELKLLRELIASFDRSAPSESDVEKGLESGMARLMLLEGQLRGQESRPSEMRHTDEPYDLVEEIRSLREAVSELRARTNPGGSAPLAQGFVLRRKP